MKRKPIKTKIDDIVDYWSERISESDISVDWTEANSHFWRCGYKSKLDICHIVPDSLGGIDAPNNLVLLCICCHTECNRQNNHF